MQVTNTILLLFLCVGFVNAQEVLEFNKIPTNTDIDLAKAKKADAATYYELNEDLFENNMIKVGTTISVQTINGNEELKVTRVSEYIPGIKSYRAVSEEQSSKVFSFTYSQGSLNGLFHRSHSENYHFSFSSKEKKNYLVNNPEKEELTCGVTHNEADIDLMISKSKEKSIESTSTTFATTSSNTTIDILVAYTSNAELWARSSDEFFRIPDLIAQAMNLSQTVLDNSNIPITLRLVYSHRLDYKESFGEPSGDILRLFTASPTFNPWGIADGKMDEIHDLRNQYGADLVTLFVDINDSGGVAWVGRNRTGSPDLGFSLNDIRVAGNSYTLMHELGHNMGNFHSRTQTTQQAPITGGVFHESVGYQDLVNNRATVMAYTTGGLTRIPVFSNPFINWEGVPVGINNPIDITNASLSLRKIKDVIASYRIPKVEVPVGEVSTNKIDVNLKLGESASIPVTIENSGDSDLTFEIDFEHQTGVVLKAKEIAEKSSVTEKKFISTSFESSSGFLVRSYEAVKSWRVFAGSNFNIPGSNFNISDQDPSDGSFHLRLSSNGTGQERTIFGPYLGALSLGSYRVNFDVRIADVENINTEDFEIYFLDGKTGKLSSGIRITDGNFWTLEANEGGGASFTKSSVSAQPGVYYSVEIDYNSLKGTYSYIINSELVNEVPFKSTGNTPAEIAINTKNKVSGASLDFDKYSVIRYSNPYLWLTTNKTSGVINPGAATNVSLNFSTKDIPGGTYNTKLTVTTSELMGPKFEIPIELVISGTLSSEEEEGIPSEISLDQNYPNPFNPSTKISYSIPTSGDVLLEVFNIQGQKVATLYEGSQQAGIHEVLFDARSLSSGVYIYRLQSGSSSFVKQMVLIK